MLKRFPINMRPAILLIFGLLSLSAMGQVTTAAITKEWTYAGKEEFGVLRPPESNFKADYLNVSGDGTFSMLKEGKQWSGKWVFQEKNAILLLTDLKTKKTISYTIKSVSETQLIAEYQSPDLVRTKYHFSRK